MFLPLSVVCAQDIKKLLMNFSRIFFWWDGMCDEQQLIIFFNSKDGMMSLSCGKKL